MVYLKLVIQREYSALFFFLLSLGVIYKAHWAFCSLFCRSYEFLTYIDTYIWLKLACALPTQGIQQVCYNTPLPGSTYISFGMEEHLSHSFSCNVAILVLHDWPNAITWHGHGEAAPLTSRIKSFLMSGGHEKNGLAYSILCYDPLQLWQMALSYAPAVDCSSVFSCSVQRTYDHRNMGGRGYGCWSYSMRELAGAEDWVSKSAFPSTLDVNHPQGVVMEYMDTCLER